MNLFSSLKDKKILLVISAQHDYVRSVMNAQTLSKIADVTILSSTAYRYPMRFFSVLLRYLFSRKREYDVVFVSFLAQPILPVIRLFFKGTVICDAYISLYDTLCLDRRRFKDGGIISWLIKKFEFFSLKLSNHIVTDTIEHKKFYMKTYGLSEELFSVLYLGAPREFFMAESIEEKDGDVMNVFFYGAGNPLHGIDVILKAIPLVNKYPIKFTLVGPVGRIYPDLVSNLNSDKVELIPWVPYEELPNAISKSEVCLGGHFGKTPKAHHVIAGKTYQFAAMGKALILGRNNANKEIFTDNVDCVMVDMGDPGDLAAGLVELYKDSGKRVRISQAAHQRVENI